MKYIVFSCLVFFALSGCAMSGRTDAKQAKRGHEVIQEKRQVTVPVEGQAPQVITLTTTTERWLDEDIVTHSDDERHSAPDVAAISAAVTPVLQASGSLGWAQVGGGLATLALTTAAGWMARRGEVRDLKADRDEGWQKHQESQAQALELAKQLPPS